MKIINGEERKAINRVEWIAKEGGLLTVKEKSLQKTNY